ncbi:MAG: hypothetical protein AAGK23_04750, partial [Pseudomonadota bacterium]
MTDMSDRRLIELLQTYGADPSAWPEAERAAGLARLAERPDIAQSALADAEALDAALDHLPHIDLPDGLIASIIAAAPQPQRPLMARLSARLFPAGRRWPAGT